VETWKPDKPKNTRKSNEKKIATPYPNQKLDTIRICYEIDVCHFRTKIKSSLAGTTNQGRTHHNTHLQQEVVPKKTKPLGLESTFRVGNFKNHFSLLILSPSSFYLGAGNSLNLM